MPQELHIVVQCTDRKLFRVPSALRLGRVPRGDIAARARDWATRLQLHTGAKVPALTLYGGDHWVVARGLPGVAASVGVQADLRVCSAGYGLVEAGVEVHPYSATFAPGHKDGVAPAGGDADARREMLVDWWRCLGESNPSGDSRPRSLTALVQASPRTQVLLVASPPYLAALEADLTEACAVVGPRQFLIVTSDRRAAPRCLQDNVILSSVRLRARIGGSCGSLNVRLAAEVLRRYPEWGLSGPDVARHVENMAAHTPRLQLPQRRPASDGEVKRFIASAMRRDPSVGHTPLLREFRASGRACEQFRFRQLHSEVKEEFL